MLVEDEDNGEAESNQPSEAETDQHMAKLDVVEINQTVEVSLNSVIGVTLLRTIKLRGTIREQEVVTLFDPGATHNFISLEVVKKLQLSVSKTEKYGVTLGFGGTVRSEGLRWGVVLQL